MSHTDRGSAPVEFILVGTLATLLAVSVIQFAFVLHVRNTVRDAASEGARYALLEGNGAADGAQRARDLVALAVGSSFAARVEAVSGLRDGLRVVEVRVECPLTLAASLLPVGSETLRGIAARPATRAEIGADP